MRDEKSKLVFVLVFSFILHPSSFIILHPSSLGQFALVVKRNIIPCFERGVPGSNPGRGTMEGMRDEG